MILSLVQFDAGDEFRKGFLRVSYSTVNNSFIQDYTQRDDHISPGFQESRHSDSANKLREMDQIHFNFVKIVRCISPLKVEKQGLLRLQGRRSTPPLFHDKVTYMTLKQETLKPQSR